MPASSESAVPVALTEIANETKEGSCSTCTAQHWHGAGPEHFMSHLALHEHAEDGVATHWGAHVTDEEYRAG